MSERDRRTEEFTLDDAIEALRRSPTPDGPPLPLVNSTGEKLNASIISPELLRLQRRRKLIMRIAGLSGLAAAVVLVAIVIGSFLLFDQGASYAFAGVIKNVKQAKSVIFTNKQKIGQQPAFEFTWYMQGNHTRIEFPGVMAEIANLKTKKGLRLDFVRKVAIRKTIHPDAATAFMNPVQQLRRIRPKDAKHLGQKLLDGKKVDLYRVDKLDFFGMKGKGEMMIWVNPKSQLPVKIEVKANTRLGAKGKPYDTVLTFENFSWHTSIDAALFSLEAPKGFTVKNK